MLSSLVPLKRTISNPADELLLMREFSCATLRQKLFSSEPSGMSTVHVSCCFIMVEKSEVDESTLMPSKSFVLITKK